MDRWSREEANRTVDEIKRRTLIDPEFRALALSHPTAAIARVNPRPLPVGLTIRFIESTARSDSPQDCPSQLTIVLPPPVANADELSDAELEQAAGGETDIKLPID